MERSTLPSNGGESGRRTRGSGSSARRSVPLDPQVLRASRALLQRTGFQGIAMVEYKHPPAGGAWTLMEINGRPWGSMHLPIHCGIDYPRHLGIGTWKGGSRPRASITGSGSLAGGSSVTWCTWRTCGTAPRRAGRSPTRGSGPACWRWPSLGIPG